jgi:hypothetical protein
LYLDLDGINRLIQEYEKDTKALREELFRLSWYMRGGLSFSEAFMLTVEDREILAKIIDGNLETTQKQGIPFF